MHEATAESPARRVKETFRQSLARPGLMTCEASETTATPAAGLGTRTRWKKVPEVTVYFWIIKVL